LGERIRAVATRFRRHIGTALFYLGLGIQGHDYIEACELIENPWTIQGFYWGLLFLCIGLALLYKRPIWEGITGRVILTGTYVFIGMGIGACAADYVKTCPIVKNPYTLLNSFWWGSLAVIIGWIILIKDC